MAKDKKGVWTPDPSMIRKAGDPPPAASPEQIKAIAEIAKDHQDLRDARLAVLDAWNWLENSLVAVLRTAVGTNDPIIASILYFSPHSLRTRTDTISKLIDHLVTSGMKDPALRDDWQRLALKINRRRNVRNFAAHGHIITYAEPNGKNHALLAPVMMQMDVYLNAYRDGRRPGATLSEVKDAIGAAGRLREEVDAYHARLKLALSIR